MNDTLGDRMKSYEAVTRGILLPHSYTIIRVDGRAFHTYLRDAEKPFDFNFIADMQQVGVDLCGEVSGTVMAYGQSDEISLLMSDVEPQSQPWFGGVVQKMASVAAAVATASLNQIRPGRPVFDARVFTLPSVGEVANYFLWRQLDAVRNSISMAAQAVFSHKELHGVKTTQMQEMLFQRGINWNNYREVARRGWVVSRSQREEMLTYTHKRDGSQTSTMVKRSFWDAQSAPMRMEPEFFYDLMATKGE